MKRNFLKNKKSVWQKKLEHGRIIKSSKEDKKRNRKILKTSKNCLTDKVEHVKIIKSSKEDKKRNRKILKKLQKSVWQKELNMIR